MSQDFRTELLKFIRALDISGILNSESTFSIPDWDMNKLDEISTLAVNAIKNLKDKHKTKVVIWSYINEKIISFIRDQDPEIL